MVNLLRIKQNSKPHSQPGELRHSEEHPSCFNQRRCQDLYCQNDLNLQNIPRIPGKYAKLFIRSLEMFSPYALKRYIKDELKYAFKKAWSRPPKYWQPSIKITKELFWTELLRMVQERQIIFNVDECCFNRALKMDYSWLLVGWCSSVINDTSKR